MVDKQVLWTESFRPTNLGQVVGNEDAVEALKDWFDSWSPTAKKKVAILHGPAGTGKTSSVIALANERQYELVEMNASDSRNKAAIMRLAGSSAREGTLVDGAKGKRILLIDEVDGLAGREDRGGVKSLIDVIREAAVPIICTANEAYSPKLKALRKIAKVIAYRPVHPEYIFKILKKIARKEKITIPEDSLQFLANNAGGDMRSAINDFQGMVLQLKSGKVTDIELLKPYRDQTKNLQSALTELFNANDYLKGKKAIDGLKIKYDELLLWVFENAYIHTSDENLAEVYTTLADADLYLGRIMRRQSWGLLKYFFDLVSGGVAVAIDKPKKSTQHVFPQKIAMYAQTMFTRAITKSISSSLAEKIHVSQRAARTDSLYLVQQVLNNNVGDAAKMVDWLELDDNQVKSLLEKPESLRKIRSVVNAYEEERMKIQTSMGDLKHSSFDRPGDDWTAILKDHEIKKEQQLEEEKRRKEEEKKRKAEARKAAKAKKKAEAKAKKEKEKTKEKTKQVKEEPEEKEEKEQTSLDQYF
ncbi:MAG: replication factor C large subunit [Candidatus Heimdallarchaeota archaeon]